jgi:hypothetical protein
MQRSKALVVGFYIGALLVGGTVGVAADRLVVGDWLEGRTRDVRATRDRLATDLRLSAEQRIALDSIFDGARRADSTLLAPIRPLRDSVWVEARGRLRAMLTPEQLAIYDDMQARERAADARR